MDENTWRIVQIGMWLLGIQTTVIIAILGAIYASLSKKIDKLDTRIDKLEGNMHDIDKRIHVIESLLHMKDCCMLKDSNQLKKAE